MKRTFTIIALSVAMAFGASAFAQAPNAGDPIVVGSKQFTEQIVLGKVIVNALRGAGYEVTDRTNLGGTAVNRDALEAGEIDVYPNYTGTAISNWYRDYEWAQEAIAEGTSGDAYASYATVASYDAALFDLVWLRPAPANNTYALAVTSAFAEENDVTTMYDFADYVNDGGEVVLSTGDEFAQRPDGLQAFEETYGFDLSEDQMIVIAGATPAQTEQALASGQSGVNVAMAYGTDGALMAYDFVVLEDPDGAQPVFQPTPVFRGETIRAYPEIAGVLNPIFALFDNRTLQDLNAKVEVDGLSAEEVARTFLQENGFID
ncbi:MAG: glycine betaine ABC transporter substrate-binding protein [Trueperaceae bacterium]|nr:glycine betaine ABC transporter substrate-binding protein [Trueperaceae bacterium]